MSSCLIRAAVPAIGSAPKLTYHPFEVHISYSAAFLLQSSHVLVHSIKVRLQTRRRSRQPEDERQHHQPYAQRFESVIGQSEKWPGLACWSQ